MKSFSVKTILSLSLILSTPSISLAHVGHGDEFQATGGIERVEVKPETDQLLGIVVTPIDQASNDGVGVMIPVTALVEADGKQLVFVQYENFYEPVEVTTGVTEGEFIQVTKELSVGEKLVTQGSLSLYAESRKTKSSEETANQESSETSNSEEIVTSTNDETIIQENAQKISQENLDNEDNLIKSEKETSMMKVATIGGGAMILLGIGAFLFMGGNSNKQQKNLDTQKSDQ